MDGEYVVRHLTRGRSRCGHYTSVLRGKFVVYWSVSSLSFCTPRYIPSPLSLSHTMSAVAGARSQGPMENYNCFALVFFKDLNVFVFCMHIFDKMGYVNKKNCKSFS